MSVIKYRNPSDNTWTTLTNINVTLTPVVQAAGSSTTSVMSQKAVTDYISNISADKIKDTIVSTDSNLYLIMSNTGQFSQDLINLKALNNRLYNKQESIDMTSLLIMLPLLMPLTNGFLPNKDFKPLEEIKN